MAVEGVQQGREPTSCLLEWAGHVEHLPFFGKPQGSSKVISGSRFDPRPPMSADFPSDSGWEKLGVVFPTFRLSINSCVFDPVKLIETD